MPGIVGIIGQQSPEVCQYLVQAMVGSMQYEHFYESGTCFVPEFGMYGGWVAHEGSFAARQSAYTDRNDVTLLFSGECFPPYLSTDKSASPIPRGGGREVDRLLRLYEEEGDRFIGQMNGLFSGLLIDRKRKRALLFNDRYGIERIYFYEKDGTTFFASEAKALLRVVPELRAFDDEGVAQFLTFGCTMGERTLFHNVRFLSGGSIWIFDESAHNRKEKYFSPENWESQPALTEEAFELEFMETFRRILPRYVSCDSPIGISLTGGLDSRMIMACIPRIVVKPICYTFSGLTDELLDARLAARVAQICGLEHHDLRIREDFLSNYGNYVDRTVFVTDGCAGALTAHEIYLNSLSRPLSRVRLTGNFGSEILRSVSTFKPINVAVELFDEDFNLIINSSLRNISYKEEHPVTFAAFQEVPWKLFGTLAAGRSQLTFRTPYLDNEIVALAFRAPSSSRLSPRSALRLVNVCNPELGKIPTDRGLVWGSLGPGYVMRRLFSEVTFKLDYLHKEGLPHCLSPLDPLIGSLSKFGLLGLHKFLPYRGWFRRELATYVGDTLTDAQTQRLPYWNSSFLKSIVADHISGRKNYIQEIHAILSLEAVERMLIRSAGKH
jgi:asparagine synthase (glutamine-hydrolysing)